MPERKNDWHLFKLPKLQLGCCKSAKSAEHREWSFIVILWASSCKLHYVAFDSSTYITNAPHSITYCHFLQGTLTVREGSLSTVDLLVQTI
jgi:hypothetical protein